MMCQEEGMAEEAICLPVEQCREKSLDRWNRRIKGTEANI